MEEHRPVELVRIPRCFGEHCTSTNKVGDVNLVLPPGSVCSRLFEDGLSGSGKSSCTSVRLFLDETCPVCSPWNLKEPSRSK
jgi:hypothetical protein